MQWNAEAHGGFTDGEPWLPLAKNYIHDNVARLAADPHSIFNLYRALITLRRTTPALMAGSYAPVATTGDLLAYRREYAGNALLIVLNLGAEPISIGSDTMAFSGELLLSTRPDRADETVSGGLVLRGDEGLIIRLQ
jgi:alpha-glucosidase